MNRNILDESEYYPTPPKVARQLFMPYLKKVDSSYYFKREYSLLEPSAGTGSILDELRESLNDERFTADVIESNFDMQNTLTGKKYQLIEKDFLKFETRNYYNLILMNPPFSSGTEHLLKAWEILTEGDIACLLNAETIRNPNTRNKELLQRLIQENGTVEYIGEAFSKASRKTNVEVALVRLVKKVAKPVFDFAWADSSQTEFNTENQVSAETMLSKPDMIRDRVEQFNKCIDAFGEYLKARSKYEFFLEGLVGSSFERDYKNLSVHFGDKGKGTFTEFLQILKRNSWAKIFSLPGFDNFMTSQIKKDFEIYCERNEHIDFTEKNIKEFLQNLFLSRTENIKSALLIVFNDLTKYDKTNRVHVEGWKSNEAWKVTKKNVIPYALEFRSWSKSLWLSESKKDFFRDLEKVLCFLSGKKLDDIVSVTKAFGEKPGEKYTSEFFDFRVYKKGTVHLIWRDLKLLDKFNIEAARGKGWLPDDYKEREKGNRL